MILHLESKYIIIKKPFHISQKRAGRVGTYVLKCQKDGELLSG